MDILHLIDRLEELFNESRALPFTHNVIVDEDRMLDIIDQMRIAIPEEVKKAQQLLNQSERIIAQAEEKANRLTSIAQEKADEMISQDVIAQEATRRADVILAQARADADDSVVDTLSRVEGELGRLLAQVQNGIQTVEEMNKD